VFVSIKYGQSSAFIDQSVQAFRRSAFTRSRRPPGDAGNVPARSTRKNEAAEENRKWLEPCFNLSYLLLWHCFVPLRRTGGQAPGHLALMMCKSAEVAEVQILGPEAVAKRWREGVEAMAFSADILKFGITEPAVPKLKNSKVRLVRQSKQMRRCAPPL
jgi:hypothetical protein